MGRFKSYISLPAPFFISIVVVGFLVAVQPFFRPFSLSPFDWQRWVEAFLLAILSGPSLYLFFTLSLHLSKLLRCLLLCSVVLTITSAIVSSVGWVSWVSLLRFWLWVSLLVSLPFVLARTKEGFRSSLAWGVIAGLGFYAFYVGIGVFVLAYSGIHDRIFAVAGFVNVNHAAGFLALSVLILPALSAKYFSSFSYLKSVSVTLIASIFVLLLLIIGSRGAFVGILAGVSAVALVAKRDVLVPYSKTLFSYVFYGGGVYIILYWLANLDETALDKKLFSDSGRLELYRLALDGISASPILGHGPLSFASVEETPFAHPHNGFLTFLYEYGGLATLLASMLLLTLGLWTLKHRSSWQGSLESVAGLAVVVAFVTHSQVSGVGMIPLALCILALGIGYWISPILRNFSLENVSIRLCLGLSLTVGGMYLALVLGYWVRISEFMATSPRFWLRGGLPLPL